MKPSKYNYYLPWEDGRTLFFNGLTKRFFFISDYNKDSTCNLIQNPDTDNAEYTSFYEKMENYGFIVNDSDDEVKTIKSLYDSLRMPKHYMLMIYPTYSCNLRCWYCIQEHRKVFLSADTKNRLKEHIKTYIEENDINELYLSWFGGEPLLCYDSIIDINSYAKDICQSKNVHFSSGITTNATLLTPQRIKRLSELGVEFYQITIDGCREKHESVKFMEGTSSFDRTLNNIKEILNIAPRTECVLRINYDEKTLDAKSVMKDLERYFSPEIKSKLSITAKKIWQVEETSLPPYYLSKFNKALNDGGYNVHHYFFGMCYVNHHNFYTIYPDGSVGKCDNDHMDEARGYLDEKGNIVWNSTYAFTDFDHFESATECSTCRHFPMCWGPCPKVLERMLADGNGITCNQTLRDEKIISDIYDYIKANENV